jgi:hypothetical protein
LCVQEALISPDGKSLTAIATQQTANSYRSELLRIALPSGRSSVLFETLGETTQITNFIQDGSGQHVIVVSGSQAAWIRAGQLAFLKAPASTVQLFFEIATIAW